MRRIVVGFALGVVLTLGAVRLLSASAGAPVPKPGDVTTGPGTPVPKPGDVITGHDLGFRVKRVGDGQVVGMFVVRVNGEWTEAEEQSLPRVIPAKP
jgi:hypothetical protein